MRGTLLRAIETGKNIFVEKPLCITREELAEIEEALAAPGGRVGEDGAPLIMVGFNRRFSPAAQHVRAAFADVSAPLTVSIRFNAGDIPADHWTQHDEEGGGRIIGEACHGIDLATYLVGAPVVRVFAESVASSGPGRVSDDQCFITLRHANGSVSNVGYLAGGDKAFPKERVEVIGGGRVAVIDDFRIVTICRNGKQKTMKGPQRKGHVEEIDAFIAAIKSGGEAPISWRELKATSLAAILAVQSLREGCVCDL